jgi:hypothetical protein
VFHHHHSSNSQQFIAIICKQIIMDDRMMDYDEIIEVHEPERQPAAVGRRPQGDGDGYFVKEGIVHMDQAGEAHRAISAAA